jgi:hypothetical protein
MPLPVLPAAPTVPARSQPPADFNSNVAAFLAWMGEFSGDLPAWAAALIQAAADANYNTVSGTSLEIGTGAKVFVIEPNMLFRVGQFVIAASAADPTRWMFGQVTAHNPGTGSLSVNVTRTGGSGTRADWVVALSGVPAIDGVSPTLPYASQAEAEGGGANNRIMTPERTLQAMQALGGWTDATFSITASNPAAIFFSMGGHYREAVIRGDNVGHNNGSNAAIQVQAGVGGTYTTILTTASIAPSAGRRFAVHVIEIEDGGLVVRGFDDDGTAPGTPILTHSLVNVGGKLANFRIQATAGNLDQGTVYNIKRW